MSLGAPPPNQIVRRDGEGICYMTSILKTMGRVVTGVAFLCVQCAIGLACGAAAYGMYYAWIVGYRSVAIVAGMVAMMVIYRLGKFLDEY
jgi:hypothetical protein